MSAFAPLKLTYYYSLQYSAAEFPANQPVEKAAWRLYPPAQLIGVRP